MSYISHDLRFIYVRVPRTASGTFTHYLEKFCATHAKPAGQQHASAIALAEIHAAQWPDYLTFGFIRNPWDWLVSMYHGNISASPFGKEPIPGRPQNTLSPHAAPIQRVNMDFETWVRQRQSTPADWLADASGEIMVDEVRRFEDFIPDVPVKVGGKDRPHYREWYTDDLAAYVESKCAREIEIGSYAF